MLKFENSNMGEVFMKYDKKEIKESLIKAMFECSKRGLLQSMKWLGELSSSLGDIPVDCSNQATAGLPQFGTSECDTYYLAKCYFDLKEYDRCAYFTKKSNLPYSKFLHYFSKYLSYEKKKLDNMSESSQSPDPKLQQHLFTLYTKLKSEYCANSLDGYGLYLYGVVLKKLDLGKDALTVLVEAVHKEPMHWGGWMELEPLITDSTKLKSLSLPDHWMTQLFTAHALLEQQLTDRALEIYAELEAVYFPNNPYIISQIAVGYHNKRDVVTAIETFSKLNKQDPYRLDNLDTFSNLLYVKGLRTELSYLAHHAAEVDKYRIETCCIIGNYYSLRADHHKSVLYFQRALKLNPQYLSAWTLMGHEFMEMKNTNAAIQSYRQAIEVNRRDYRAWYGLGQTYEIIRMYFFSLYYYKQAQQLRPNDSRMLIALGEAYDKLDKVKEAIKCFARARSLGDAEGIAILQLGKLYEKLGDVEQAVKVLKVYVTENESSANDECFSAGLSYAYKYLANYYMKNSQLDNAYIFAQKCLNHEETKEEGKALLKTIAQKRGQEDEGEMQIVEGDEGNESFERFRAKLADVTPMYLSFTPPDNQS